MELKDTVKLMNSADYKDRFKAEYWQVIIRQKKLTDMLKKWDKEELDFTPTCARSIYNIQLQAMNDYIAMLKTRAYMEGIDLDTKKCFT